MIFLKASATHYEIPEKIKVDLGPKIRLGLLSQEELKLYEVATHRSCLVNLNPANISNIIDFNSSVLIIYVNQATLKLDVPFSLIEDSLTDYLGVKILIPTP